MAIGMILIAAFEGVLIPLARPAVLAAASRVPYMKKSL
jgi:hypothetical protein